MSESEKLGVGANATVVLVAKLRTRKLRRCWHPGRSKFGRTSMTRPVSASRAVDDRHRIDLDAPIRGKGIGKPARALHPDGYACPARKVVGVTPLHGCGSSPQEWVA